MTTWDEKAADAAIEYAKPTMRPVQTMSDHMADAFHDGARWQREALLSDETVERAAMAILLRNYPACTPDEARWFAGASGVDDARNKARTALTEAIGDE